MITPFLLGRHKVGGTDDPSREYNTLQYLPGAVTCSSYLLTDAAACRSANISLFYPEYWIHEEMRKKRYSFERFFFFHTGLEEERN
jgi:hypothetical protein